MPVQLTIDLAHFKDMEDFQCGVPRLAIYLIILALFWTLFQCDPPYAGWDPIRTAREGREFHCTSDSIVGSTLSVVHVVMDFGLLSVPLIVLWNVRMGWGTRLRLYFVFSIGAMSFIGSVVRQVEQERLSADILCELCFASKDS